jgi:hypothetical protein
VLKAWLEKVRLKLDDKSRFKEAFSMLRDILHNKATGDYDAKLLTIDHAIEEFKSAFALETALVKYFETTWEKKKGVSKSKTQTI